MGHAGHLADAPGPGPLLAPSSLQGGLEGGQAEGGSLGSLLCHPPPRGSDLAADLRQPGGWYWLRGSLKFCYN